MTASTLHAFLPVVPVVLAAIGLFGAAGANTNAFASPVHALDGLHRLLAGLVRLAPRRAGARENAGLALARRRQQRLDPVEPLAEGVDARLDPLLGRFDRVDLRSVGRSCSARATNVDVIAAMMIVRKAIPWSITNAPITARRQPPW